MNNIYKNKGIYLFNKDFLKANNIKPHSVDLIITSPPYNLEVGFKNDIFDSYKAYLKFTEKYLRKLLLLSKIGGRLCLNIPFEIADEINNKIIMQPAYADIVTIAERLGWTFKTTIFWNKSEVTNRSAWGSWLSPSAPNVIAPMEAIVLFYKEQWKIQAHDIRAGDIAKEDFIKWTYAIWNIPPKKVTGYSAVHPATFSRELVKRLLYLFSYPEARVLDPFVGSGTTLIECFRLNRVGVGYEIDEKYYNMSIERLETEAHIKLDKKITQKKTQKKLW